MTQAVAKAKTGRMLTLEVCHPCCFVWFDPDTYQFTPLPTSAKSGPRQTQADIDAESFLEAQKMIQIERKENPAIEEDWKSVPGYFGLPVEVEPPTDQRGGAVVTWFMAFALMCIGLAALSNLKDLVQEYGLIPREAARYYGLTFITSFFLHGGILHLAVNVYFLVLFGREVERDIGPWRWLFLLFAAAFAGSITDVIFDPRNNVPMIGASGGISGLLAYYVLSFPHARLQMPVRPLIRPLWFEVPAWVFFVGWIILQIGGALDQVSGQGDVASLAHLGGLTIGLAFWLVWKEDAAAKPS
jgi:membrane associated rhomboid family serine protease